MINSLRAALVCAAAVAVFASTLSVSGVWVQASPQQAQPGVAAQAPPAGAARQGGGGRGRGRGPQDPTPRLADGTVNFGRVPGEKGTYERSLHHQHGDAGRHRSRQHDSWFPRLRLQQQAAAAARARRRRGAWRRCGGGGGGGRGGSKSEPWMPWMPWSAAVYDYNSKNESKYDPEGYCLPPGGPRMMATPYQMEIIQHAGAQAHRDDLRRRHAHLARDLHGRPEVPGRRRS